MASVVEQSTIPQLMLSLRTTMEIAAVRAIKLVQAIQNILASVAVDHIEQNNQTKTVCGINKLFQLVGGTVSTACSKEAVDLVAETSIVCVLHDSHELDDIIAQMLYSRKHVLCELFVCRHSQFGRGNSYVCFVHTDAFWLLWSRVLEDVSFGDRRIPKSAIVDWGYREVLCHILDPCWYTLDAFARGRCHGNLKSQQEKQVRKEMDVP